MTLPIDAGTWSEDRLVHEMSIRLPKGWSYKVYQSDNDFWFVNLYNVHKDLAFSETDSTAQLVLLTTIGWLELQAAKHGSTKATPWAPRTKEFPTGAHEEAYRKLHVDEDPPDLDPKEIAAVVASVYSRTRR